MSHVESNYKYEYRNVNRVEYRMNNKIIMTYP